MNCKQSRLSGVLQAALQQPSGCGLACLTKAHCEFQNLLWPLCAQRKNRFFVFSVIGQWHPSACMSRGVAAICIAAKRKLSDFSPQNFANLAWVVATLHMNEQKGCCCDLHCSTDKGSAGVWCVNCGCFWPTGGALDAPSLGFPGRAGCVNCGCFWPTGGALDAPSLARF